MKEILIGIGIIGTIIIISSLAYVYLNKKKKSEKKTQEPKQEPKQEPRKVKNGMLIEDD